jgi:hypothetical protein
MKTIILSVALAIGFVAATPVFAAAEIKEVCKDKKDKAGKEVKDKAGKVVEDQFRVLCHDIRFISCDKSNQCFLSGDSIHRFFE